MNNRDMWDGEGKKKGEIMMFENKYFFAQVKGIVIKIKLTSDIEYFIILNFDINM